MGDFPIDVFDVFGRLGDEAPGLLWALHVQPLGQVQLGAFFGLQRLHHIDVGLKEEKMNRLRKKHVMLEML